MKKKIYEDGHRYFSNPVKAIRELCVECNDSQTFSKKQSDCVAGKDGARRCPVYPFRFGNNPFYQSRKRELSEEEKQAITERLRNGRKAATNLLPKTPTPSDNFINN